MSECLRIRKTKFVRRTSSVLCFVQQVFNLYPLCCVWIFGGVFFFRNHNVSWKQKLLCIAKVSAKHQFQCTQRRKLPVGAHTYRIKPIARQRNPGHRVGTKVFAKEWKHPWMGPTQIPPQPQPHRQRSLTPRQIWAVAFINLCFPLICQECVQPCHRNLPARHGWHATPVEGRDRRKAQENGREFPHRTLCNCASTRLLIITLTLKRY